MARINPGTNLTGSIQITPQRTGVDTFADVRSQRLVSPDIVDLVPLSNTLARYVGEKEAQATEITEDIVRSIAQKVEQGEDQDELLKKYSSDESTPTRVKSRLSKLFNKMGLVPTANPLYIKAYREGQGNVRLSAFRGEMLMDSQIAEVAKAGIDAGPGESYAAMLGVVQKKIAGSNLYEGMDVFGTEAINNRLLDVSAEVMDRAKKKYDAEIVRGVHETFGATYLMLGEKLDAALRGKDTELTQSTLESMALEYTNLRVSGEPNHKEILVDSLVNFAKDLGNRNPEAAADFLDTVVNELSEGGAEVFRNDLAGRAQLSTLEYALRDRALDEGRKQDIKDAERAEEVELALNTRFGADLRRAQAISNDAVTQALDSMQETVFEGLTDPKDIAAAGAWLDAQTLRSQQVASAMDNSGMIRGRISKIIRSESPADARRTLSRSEWQLNTSDWLALDSEIKTRESAAWAYEREDVRNFSRRFEDTLIASGVFTDDPQGRANMLAATARVEEEFFQDLYDFTASTQFTGAALEMQPRLLDKFIRDFNNRKREEVAPPTKSLEQGPVEQGIAALTSIKAIADTNPEDFKKAPAKFAGFDEATMPKPFKRLMRFLDGSVYAPRVQRDEVAQGFGTLARDNLAKSLEDILTDPDIADAAGTKVSPRTAQRAAVEIMAYRGAFTIDELITAEANPSTIETWGGEKRPALAKVLTAYLSFGDTDINRVPIPEVGKLLRSVQPGNVLKVIPEDAAGVEKVRQLLRSFGVSPADESVAAFINHQYLFTTN